MRLQVVSDLHLEFQDPVQDKHLFGERLCPKAGRPELLVLAGDIVNLKDRPRVEQMLEQVSKRWTDAIWVMGNHEYVGVNPAGAEQLLEDLRVPSNVEVVVRPRTITYKGLQMHCGTLWYARAAVEAAVINPDNGLYTNKRGRLVQFFDYREILGAAAQRYELHDRMIGLLQDELLEGDVVVTHHLPHPRCTPARFRGEVEDCFFMSDQGALIAERGPALWLHGHTHDPVDFEVSSPGPNDQRRVTRVVANPWGYPGERAKNKLPFSPDDGVVELA